MRVLPAIVFTAAMAAAQSNRAELLRVNAVRHWTLPATTRVIIEVSGDFQYHSDRLQNPDRIFFDVLHSRPAITARESLNRELDDRLLKKIRVAETTPGVTRVVLDLLSNPEVTASQLTNPNRLVIELRNRPSGPATPEAPAVT